MYKPLRKRKIGSYTSSLRKIINDEVENKISALKKEGVDPPSKEQQYFTTFDYDYGPTLEAPEDYYSKTSDYSKEEFEKKMGSDQVDIQNERYTAEQWNKEAEEVSFDNLTPEQKASLDNFYGEDIEKREGTKILKKDGKFYLDQGQFFTDETGVTKPLEITDPAFNQAPDKAEAASEEAPSQPSAGSKNIMELFNVNPEFGGSLTENAKSFYDTSYSEDNPVLDVLQDEKWMRKARKEYDKLNLSNQKRSQMPFEKWAMKTYKPKGQDGSLNVMAKSWERENKNNADREVTSSKGVVESGRRKGNPFDREAGQEQSPETINQFNMNRNASSKGQSKMIKAFGKPMSFRNNKH
tara:strand:+ start:517 stop:1575 length:1059 start_codon:yes stop_codon:yes gene_type:complete